MCSNPARPRFPQALVLIALAVAPLGAQQHHDAMRPEDVKKLGNMTFPSSCVKEQQQNLTRAVAMLHSFWFEQANKAFSDIAAADPTCAMAQWGLAMTALGNPFVRQPIPQPRLQIGLAAAEKAIALAAKQTPREQAYAAAAAALYRDAGTRDHLARLQAHEDAMKVVHEAYPEDAEAAIFYARALIATSPPNDLAYAKQKQAAAILDPLFRKNGKHPGIAHYLIHAFDAPPIAGGGLDAARRYADIAPSAPHALHMPSHIFTRLGYWDESIETNQRSARAEPDSNAAVHPLDYMVYAYLQLGRDADAERIIRNAADSKDDFYRGIIGYNFVAMPVRYALERAYWKDAAVLKVPAGMPPHIEAIPRFGRAIGAARSSQPAIARAEVDTLGRLTAKLRAANDTYWATVVEAQRLAAAAWLAHAEKRDPEAMTLAKQAADLEETIEKHPVTPGPLLPARELEGDLLLELGRPKEAQESYTKTLAREPRRARALFGVARAAELAGDDATAKKRYNELLDLMKRADPDRLEPRRARQYLSLN